MKTSLLLGVVGIGMLLASLLPWTPSAPPPTEVTATQPPSPATISQAEQGRLLFAAKGCAGCHEHAALQGGARFTWDGPPNLTDYRGDPTFLREWLRDPQAVRPGVQMPDLDLSDAEIEALIAFLSNPETE